MMRLLRFAAAALVLILSPIVFDAGDRPGPGREAGASREAQSGPWLGTVVEECEVTVAPLGNEMVGEGGAPSADLARARRVTHLPLSAVAIPASLIEYLAASYKAPLGVGFAAGAAAIMIVGALAPGWSSHFVDPGLAMMAVFIPSFLLAAIGFRRWVTALKRKSEASERPTSGSRTVGRR